MKRHVPVKEQKSNFPINEELQERVLLTNCHSTTLYDHSCSVLKKTEALARLLPTADFNSDTGSITMNLVTETGNHSLLLTDKEYFASIVATKEFGVICYSIEEPQMDGVSDMDHYCMTDDALLFWNGTSWDCLAGAVFVSTQLEENHDVDDVVLPAISMTEDSITISENEETPTEVSNAAFVAIADCSSDIVEKPVMISDTPLVSETTDTIPADERHTVIIDEDLSRYDIFNDSSATDICNAIL